MISRPPPAAAASPRPEQRNGQAAPAAAPLSRGTRLHHGGYWTRWVIGLTSLLALLNALGCIGLFVAGLVPVPLLIYVVTGASLLALLAVVVSPPVYAPPSPQRLEAEEQLRNGR